MGLYVIRQGDYLSKLAHKFGFDENVAWNDPANSDLQTQRPNPNILLPTDVLHFPDPPEDQTICHDLQTGSTNTFQAPDPPKATITVTFVGVEASSYGSKAYTVTEAPDLTGLSTSDDGTATFAVAVTLDAATVVFTETGESVTLAIGQLDPAETQSGVFQRLQNLGYLDREAVLNTDSDDHIGTLRLALRLFESDSGDSPGANADSTSGDASEPDPSQESASDGDSSADPALDDDVLRAGRADWDVESPSGDSADGVQTSSGEADTAQSSNDANGSSSDAQASNDPASDTAGVADDGALSPDMVTRLSAAFGC